MMKKCIIGMMFFAATAHAQTIKIAGKIAGWKTGTEVHLTNIAQVDIPVKVAVDGSFNVSIPKLSKGIYNLPGIGYIYLEPGYSLKIEPGQSKTGYTFTGKGALENTLMVTTRKQIKDYFLIGDDGFLFKTYLMAVDTFLNQMNNYKKSAYRQLSQSSSGFFKQLAQKDIDFYCFHYLSNYRLFYGVDSVKQEAFYKLLNSGKPSPEAINSAYAASHIKVLSNKQRVMLDSLYYKNWDMNDSLLFVNSVMYREAVSNKITNLMYTNFRADFSARKEQSLIKLKAVQKNISNQFIADYYTYTFTGDIIKMSKDSVLKDSVYKAFVANMHNSIYKTSIAEVYNNYIYMLSKKTAPDFMYANVDGQKIALSSLRGKYVYIDVWATWCGPCKKEIPFLSDIEEEYKGRKIQFISLSVDVANDTDKWKQYVRSNNLKGIQLIADKDFKSDFIKKFNINSIPRFILIDPEGKIVSGDAKRPSDPELKTLFNKLL